MKFSSPEKKSLVLALRQGFPGPDGPNYVAKNASI